MFLIHNTAESVYFYNLLHVCSFFFYHGSIKSRCWLVIMVSLMFILIEISSSSAALTPGLSVNMKFPDVKENVLKINC